MRYDLAVIVPTKNEAGNVRQLVSLLDTALAGIAWQVIFVDDNSSDGTAGILREMSQSRDNLVCLRRIGRQGLSSAVIEGMMAAGAAYVAVMDADLQHDETLLPVMLKLLQEKSLDAVVASRFLQGSERQNFSAFRERLSNTGILLSRLVTRTQLTDPLSGFFMLRSAVVEDVVPRLNGQGFKVLLDIFASSSRPLRYEEVPLIFRERNAGESKLDTLVSLEFVLLLVDKFFGRIIPLRFLTFMLVGLTGMMIHLSLLGIFHMVLNLPFLWSQVGATLTAMTSNFFLNNRITYRDRRLSGKALFTGLLSFWAICGLGALGNFMVAQFLFTHTISWWISGLIGAVVSAIWNYGVTASFTWSSPVKLGENVSAKLSS